MGNVEVAYGFYTKSLLCCPKKTVFPYFLRENSRNLFII